MNKGRYGHTMEVVNGKLTVYGGWGEKGPETSIEELNEDGESWGSCMGEAFGGLAENL